MRPAGKGPDIDGDVVGDGFEVSTECTKDSWSHMFVGIRRIWREVHV
jgi:hypothetical protein